MRVMKVSLAEYMSRFSDKQKIEIQSRMKNVTHLVAFACTELLDKELGSLISAPIGPACSFNQVGKAIENNYQIGKTEYQPVLFVDLTRETTFKKG